MQKVDGSSPFIRLGIEPKLGVSASGSCPKCAPNVAAALGHLEHRLNLVLATAISVSAFAYQPITGMRFATNHHWDRP